MSGAGPYRRDPEAELIRVEEEEHRDDLDVQQALGCVGRVASTVAQELPTQVRTRIKHILALADDLATYELSIVQEDALKSRPRTKRETERDWKLRMRLIPGRVYPGCKTEEAARAELARDLRLYLEKVIEIASRFESSASGSDRIYFERIKIAAKRLLRKKTQYSERVVWLRKVARTRHEPAECAVDGYLRG